MLNKKNMLVVINIIIKFYKRLCIKFDTRSFILKEKVRKLNEKICTNCKTGADLVALDKQECFCIYIALCKNNNCPMFKKMGKKKI